MTHREIPVTKFALSNTTCTATAWEEEARLWSACFENPACKLVMTPGRDCRHDKPGCFRMCFAAVKREALPVAAKRLAGLLSQFK